MWERRHGYRSKSSGDIERLNEYGFGAFYPRQISFLIKAQMRSGLRRFDSWQLSACELRLAAPRLFGQIHFVDFTMERSAADAEFFGSRGHVAVRRCKGLRN